MKMKMNLCPESESDSAQKQRAIMEDLVKGLEAAIQLKVLLQNPSVTEPSLSSHHLIADVTASMIDALCVISSSTLLPGSADGLAYLNVLFSRENGSPVTGSGIDPTSGHCSEERSEKGGRGGYSRRNDEILHERSDNEMQNQGNESLDDKFRGKARISDSISSLPLLSESSDRATDLSNSHDYSGPS